MLVEVEATDLKCMGNGTTLEEWAASFKAKLLKQASLTACSEKAAKGLLGSVQEQLCSRIPEDQISIVTILTLQQGEKNCHS